MATYQKRGDKWRAIVRKNGITQTATFTLKKDAEAWARKLEIQIERGVPLEAEEITVSALIGRYLAEIAPKHKSYKRELSILRIFMKDNPALANKSIRDFGKVDIVYWRDRRLKQIQNGSVIREWVVLSSIFTHAVKSWGVLEHNPFLWVAKPKMPNPREQRIEQKDIQRVQDIFSYNGLTAPQTLRQYTAWAFLFALETACRLGEIAKLEPQDVQDDGLLHLRETKNGSDRYVPLSAEAKRLLTLIDLPLPYDAKKLSRCFTTYKPEDFTIRFHDTRHEAISRMALKIPNPLTLAKITGHKDLKILLNTYYNPKGSDLIGLLDT